ncbi:glycosyltransferase [Aerococcaceae bacterium WS4759]|uniref:Glycosyltransferase n=1 Tax=Fundicoccus ignavus TaxID=2664442 RepID=A0A6I2GDD5_9LACT|nr:glycosyltransferase [Fundicoccus ignavus]MRI84624.1 glycosyltransferase [Fundicoccus ignavus]
MKKLITVIMPVYNTAKYLKDSIESIINQNIDSLELIIINDGSTDNSAEIINEYVSKYEFLKCITQSNQGQGSARNKGIQLSTGKYIYFMDSDDILELNALKTITDKLEEFQLDALFFDGKSFMDEENNQHYHRDLGRTNYSRKRSYGLFNSGQELWSQLIKHNDYTVSPCLYVLKKEVIMNNELFFEEGIIHEDQLFSTLLFFSLNKCAHYNWEFFKRRIRDGSTMTSSHIERKLNGYIEVFNKLTSFYSEASFKTEFIKNQFKEYLSEILILISLTANVINIRFNSKTLSEVRKNAIKHSYFSKKAYLACKYVKLYVILSRIKNKPLRG